MRYGFSRLLVLLLCVGAITASGDSAWAHPPYEREVRVVSGDQGAQFRLFKSYIDGLIGTDPVKLVIRDASGRTVAETDYARNVTIVCWRASWCAVFQYDDFLSVRPEQIWRFEGGRLQPARSGPLVALGMVAPLWEDGVGYTVALVALAGPALVVWLLWRFWRSRLRSGASTRHPALEFAAVVLTVLFGTFWLLMSVVLFEMQSRLSLHGLMLAAAIGAAALLCVRRVASWPPAWDGESGRPLPAERRSGRRPGRRSID